MKITYNLRWPSTLDEPIPSFFIKSAHVSVWVLHIHSLMILLGFFLVASSAEIAIIFDRIFPVTVGAPGDLMIHLLNHMVAAHGALIRLPPRQFLFDISSNERSIGLPAQVIENHLTKGTERFPPVR